MSVERIIRCDAPGCEGHQHTARPAPATPPGWVRAVEDGEPPVELHFCTWDCCMKFAATIPPPEVIPFDDVEAA